MEYERPAYSKKRVNAAGKNIRDGVGTDEDEAVFKNWRASHVYILDKFHNAVQNEIRGAFAGQRLKRRRTIVNKLRRQYAEEKRDMKLARMNDIAGYRVIFMTEKKLLEFRQSLHSSNTEYQLRSGGDNRYNYIEKPKSDGYRGIHDVYAYSPSSADEEDRKSLLVEIQHRTVTQHAWATAVETFDTMKLEQTKFGGADAETREFFQLASEILARAYDERKSCLPEISNSKILDNFSSIDEELKIMEAFRRLTPRRGKAFSEYVILSLSSSGQSKRGNLRTESFDNLTEALERYSQLESDINEHTDVVLIRSEKARETYRNYFSDVTSFIGLISAGIEKLRK